MTREERHIAVLNRMLESMDVYDSIQPTTERKKAIKAAIQALSQEPCEWGRMTFDPTTGISVFEFSDGTIKQVKQAELEPCTDAVSREAVCDYIAEFVNDEYSTQAECDMVDLMIEGIQHLPSVTQKSGKWDNSCTCSVCGQWRILESEKNGGKYKFCPNCGARMDKEQTE